MPVNLLSLAAKHDTLTFPAGDGEVNVEYDPNKLTKAFRAEVVRLERELAKAERRLQHLFEIAVLVKAADGSVEAQVEDDEANRAIEEMIHLDDVLKQQMDATLLSIVFAWDVMIVNPAHEQWVQDGGVDSGRREPVKEITVPLTPEGIWPVPVTFEGEILMRLVKGSPTGEAQGLDSSKNSPHTSKPRARTRSSAQPRSKKSSSKLVSSARR